jgi:type II secretory pathway pseudopilin PulG
MRSQRGAGLTDVVVAVGLLAIGMTIALPNLAEVRRRAALDRLARTLAGHTALCRMKAIDTWRRAGLVFSPQGRGWSFTPVLDGDGDGVSRRDLDRGVDTPLAPAVPIDVLCPGAGIGVPAEWHVPRPGGRGVLDLADGVAAGRSDIISFSPLGDATPATVYFNDGHARVLAVRIYGPTARVRVLEWRLGWRAWRQVTP